MAFVTGGGAPYISGNLEAEDGGEYKEAPDGLKNLQETTGVTGDGSVDIWGRPADKATTGGWKAATFICAAAMFETAVNLGMAFNLFSYLTGPLHINTARSSVQQTCYWGTSYITSLFGGFISDAYLGRFWTTLIFGIVELLGLGLLIISATVDGIKPTCPSSDKTCHTVEGTTTYTVFMIALYMIALGSGALRPCLTGLGADQFDIEDPKQKKRIRSYFNWLFFYMSVGACVALTVIIYIAENVSWVWGFGIMGMSMVLSMVCLLAGTLFYRHKKPTGSPLTRMAQVVVASLRKRKTPAPADEAVLFEVYDDEITGFATETEPTLKRFNSNKGKVVGEPTLKRYYSLPHTKGMGLLDKAAVVTNSETGIQSTSTTPINPWRLCTVTQVEELKTVLRVIPVAMTTMFLYISIAQVQTWAVSEGYTLKRDIGGFKYPPPMLAAFAIAFVLIEVVVYDRWFVPFMRNRTKHRHGITHLQRIGFGLLQSILAMAYGAVFETIRLKSAKKHGGYDNPGLVVPISIFWLIPQWILAASAELFAYIGLFEFFWEEIPIEMRSLGGGLALLSASLGLYQAGVLVAFTNLISASSNGGWLADSNLNKNHLNYYYLIIMGMGMTNAIGFYYVTKWYSYVKFFNPAKSFRQSESSEAELVQAPASSANQDVHEFQRSESRVPLNRTPGDAGDNEIPVKAATANDNDQGHVITSPESRSTLSSRDSSTSAVPK